MSEKGTHCVVTIALGSTPDDIIVHTYGPYIEKDARRMKSQLEKRFDRSTLWVYVRKLIATDEVRVRPASPVGTKIKQGL